MYTERQKVKPIPLRGSKRSCSSRKLSSRVRGEQQRQKQKPTQECSKSKQQAGAKRIQQKQKDMVRQTTSGDREKEREKMEKCK